MSYKVTFYSFLRTHCELFIYVLSRLWPKDKTIILCSEWQGTRFTDNVAQLFSELHQDQKLRFIWIKKTKHINANFPCSGRQLYAYSLLSFFYHLRAKTFIVGSGKSDVIRAFVTSKSLLINTWHGPPLKNIYLLDVKERFRNHSFFVKSTENKKFVIPIS